MNRSLPENMTGGIVLVLTGSDDSFGSQRANSEPRAGFEICRGADSWSCAQSACELGESFRKTWGLSGWLPCLL